MMASQLSVDHGRIITDGYQRQSCLPPTYGSHSLQPLNKMQQVSPNLTPADQCRDGRGSQRDEAVNNMLMSLETRARCMIPQSEDGSSGEKQKGVEKPFHSYIALISMAILSTKSRKMLLNDIYQYIMDSFPFYNTNEKAWRNSIRHNLSLNECFVKCGRADNGKGHYWSIHPACIEDFTKGDFRRRHARRRAKRNGHRTEVDVSQMSIGYRYNIGYVPMTASSGLGYPYSSYFNAPPVGFRPSYGAQEHTPQVYHHLAENAPMPNDAKNQQVYNINSW